MFKRFKEHWNILLDSGIDMNYLSKFFIIPHLGTVLEQEVVNLFLLFFCIFAKIEIRQNYNFYHFIFRLKTL